ncbi:MAG: hypothetical protein IJA10_11315 [Lachnospiraceae bacterium]|nr:hypothetical protein [Lachnospiraceae bacterium]
MSAASGLVRFKRTGNIYMCCYEGTSDIMIPFIFKPEECLQDGYYHPISYGRKLGDENEWNKPDVDDIDEIEIYSDYGSGFYWEGEGSESAKVITKGTNFGYIYDYTNGKPKWVTDFWNSLGLR